MRAKTKASEAKEQDKVLFREALEEGKYGLARRISGNWYETTQRYHINNYLDMLIYRSERRKAWQIADFFKNGVATYLADVLNCPRPKPQIYKSRRRH